MADVIGNPSGITETSRSYSALQGGRFNAPKSHGVLYCSEHPFIAALEVTYHTVVDALRRIRQVRQLEKEYTSAMNLQLATELDFLVAVFVLQTKAVRAHEPDATLRTLRELCDSLGYSRYTTSNFDEDFIFGNDYSLTHILAANALRERHDSIRVGTARLAGRLKYKNLVLLDGIGTTTVLPQYYLFRVTAKPGDKRHPHVLSLRRADTNKGATINLLLDNVPVRPTPRSRCVREYPNGGLRRIEESRQVVVQKFSLT